MRPPRRLVAVAAVVVTVIVGGDAASAQVANGRNDDTTIGAGALNPDTPTVTPVSFGSNTSANGSPTPSGTGSGNTSSEPSPYTWRREYVAGPCVPIEGQPAGRLYRDVRTDTRTGEEVWMAEGCERPTEPSTPAAAGAPARAPNPGGLAVQALNRTPLPAPAMTMSPNGTDIPLLVNLPTFLWIDAAQWRPVTASASAGPVTSTVTATPQRVIWSMGNGESVTCNGPGAPYVPSLSDDAQPSDCSYTYSASSARSPDKTFTVTATVEWRVTWTAVGAPGGGDLGLSRRSSTATVRVAELQVLNTPARA